MDPLIDLTARRILADHAHDSDELWHQLQDSGLTRAWSGGTPEDPLLEAEDGFDLLRIAGAACATVPFAETLIASWLLTLAKIDQPAGSATFGNGVAAGSGTVQGRLLNIPYGIDAEWLVCLCHHRSEPMVALCRTPTATPATGIGQEAHGDFHLENHPTTALAPSPNWLTPETLLAFSALVRSAQIAGAIEAVLELTVDYAREREQFGRPLTRFQAIQHRLTDIAAEVAAANAAVDAAMQTISLDRAPDLRDVAVAKIRTSEAAGIVAANAHQIHGAMGFTSEYRLARYTRRLWQWRDDFGNETTWAERLGNDTLKATPLCLIRQIFGETDD